MKQYTETYRIKLSKETRFKLDNLRRFNIIPAKFIRAAINEKLKVDLPKLKQPKEKITIPF
jgi:predicted DNA-binding protein